MTTMIELIDPRIRRLPNWAQGLIRGLHRDAVDAKSALKEYLDSQSPGPLWVSRGLNEKHYIQDDRVSFQLKHGTITVALRENTLECHADYGSARLIVVPHVTNVVRLEIEDIRLGKSL